eukprot:CAMPEP_0171577170 /NCGR_PEP_ID=MMETSP0961-20121227/7059_1 /TAXON_ID=87120 /ORGANISM="Aurantiochytrium limacinum, Strain ATCCMYA-1381" /LENGTH=108 /DNA_ID=CAMNT_0012133157 /DNA_START=348 /DNA_END=675 /DNA_ORIENTATION=+
MELSGVSSDDLQGTYFVDVASTARRRQQQLAEAAAGRPRGGGGAAGIETPTSCGYRVGGAELEVGSGFCQRRRSSRTAAAPGRSLPLLGWGGGCSRCARLAVREHGIN